MLGVFCLTLGFMAGAIFGWLAHDSRAKTAAAAAARPHSGPFLAYWFLEDDEYAIEVDDVGTLHYIAEFDDLDTVAREFITVSTGVQDAEVIWRNDQQPPRDF